MCKIKLTFPDRELWEGPKLELYNTHTQNKRKDGQIGHNRYPTPEHANAATLRKFM